MLEKLTQANFKDSIKNGVCVVIVGAPWCPDCRKIEPIITLLANEYKEVKFFEIKSDEETELKESLNIRRIPTLIFYKNGQEIGERLVEPNSKPLIETTLKTTLEA
ncbi:MAG: thioredoxin family protein [Helicobacter sp.]|nr:thioredoxin family protein [Helicobacteraceae bacterium]MDY3113530.1 thioredoxin family protein [Helicobacter sp.]